MAKERQRAQETPKQHRKRKIKKLLFKHRQNIITYKLLALSVVYVVLSFFIKWDELGWLFLAWFIWIIQRQYKPTK